MCGLAHCLWNTTDLYWVWTCSLRGSTRKENFMYPYIIPSKTPCRQSIWEVGHESSQLLSLLKIRVAVVTQCSEFRSITPKLSYYLTCDWDIHELVPTSHLPDINPSLYLKNSCYDTWTDSAFVNVTSYVSSDGSPWSGKFCSIEAWKVNISVSRCAWTFNPGAEIRKRFIWTRIRTRFPLVEYVELQPSESTIIPLEHGALCQFQ